MSAMNSLLHLQLYDYPKFGTPFRKGSRYYYYYNSGELRG
jgi:prolyl oligopeptidase